MTRAIGKLIATEQTHQIPSQLQTGRHLGMQMMDQALLEAVQRKEIDPNDAYAHASEKQPFQRFATDIDVAPEAAPGVETADG